MALWKEMALAGKCKDFSLIDQLLQGLPIVGQVATSGRWPPMQPDPEAKPVEYLLERAWDINCKIARNIKSTKLSDGLTTDLGADDRRLRRRLFYRTFLVGG